MRVAHGGKNDSQKMWRVSKNEGLIMTSLTCRLAAFVLKGVLPSFLLATVGGANAALAFGPMLNGEIITEESLPADLQAVHATFKKLITPEAEQCEYRLQAELLRFTGETWQIPRQILQDDTIKVNIDHLVIENFGIKDLRSGEIRSPLGWIFSELWGSVRMRHPFFCAAFRELNVAGSMSARCRVLTEELLDAVEHDLNRPAYVVTVEGTNFGPFKQVIVYLGSITDPAVFVRYSFDVVHEF
jgi:hypothetical protein